MNGADCDDSQLEPKVGEWFASTECCPALLHDFSMINDRFVCLEISGPSRATKAGDQCLNFSKEPAADPSTGGQNEDRLAHQHEQLHS